MPKELVLPSGKIAIIEKGKGKDLLQAQMKAKTSDEIPYALIAELAEIDGQKLVYEDILEMDLEDVIALQGEISGKLTTGKAKEVPNKVHPSFFSFTYQSPRPLLSESRFPNQPSSMTKSSTPSSAASLAISTSFAPVKSK